MFSRDLALSISLIVILASRTKYKIKYTGVTIFENSTNQSVGFKSEKCI